MYVMVDTRADIIFAVSMVSQFMLKTGPPNWMAVRRIMKYFKGILDSKLCLISKDWAMQTRREIQTNGDQSQCMYFLLALESSCKNPRNNQSLHCLDSGGVHGH